MINKIILISILASFYISKTELNVDRYINSYIVLEAKSLDTIYCSDVNFTDFDILSKKYTLIFCPKTDFKKNDSSCFIEIKNLKKINNCKITLDLEFYKFHNDKLYKRLVLKAYYIKKRGSWKAKIDEGFILDFGTGE